MSSSATWAQYRENTAKVHFVLPAVYCGLAVAWSYGESSPSDLHVHLHETQEDDDDDLAIRGDPLAVPLPARAGGDAAAELAADRRLHLLPGRAQPARRLLRVERLLPAGLLRGIAVPGVPSVADLRGRAEEHRDPHRRSHRDHAGLTVHRRRGRHAHASQAGHRRQVPSGAADRLAAAGA